MRLSLLEKVYIVKRKKNQTKSKTIASLKRLSANHFLNFTILAEMAPKILRALALRVSHRTQLWGRRFEWLVPILSADWLSGLFRGVSNSGQEVKADVTSSLQGAHGVNTRLAI